MQSQDSINAYPLTTNGPVSDASVTVSEPVGTVSSDPFELDAIEVALADALVKAAAAERFDVVAQLAAYRGGPCFSGVPQMLTTSITASASLIQ